MIYAQAEPASKINAFVRVTSVIMVELAEATINSLREDRIVVAYTALRGLIERIAHATALAEALATLRSAPRDGPLTPVLELSDLIGGHCPKSAETGEAHPLPAPILAT
jgi:hypothetical protein